MTVLYQIDFKTNNITRAKEGHFITIHQEDVIVINVYPPHSRTPKYLRHS